MFRNRLQISGHQDTLARSACVIRCAVFVTGVFLLAVFFRMPKLCGWDEAFYMSQMSSGILDRDLMLQNDLLMFPNDIGERIRAATVLRSDGIHVQAFSVGPSIFYAMVMIPLYAYGVERFGPGMQRGTALWAVFVLVLAVMALDRMIQEFGYRMCYRYAAIVAAIFSTPFIRYGFRNYLSSHFLAAVLMIFSLLYGLLWLKKPCFKYAWAAGIFGGWLMITRWQTSVFMLSMIPPLYLAFASPSCRRRRIAGLGVMVLGALPLIGVQCAAWKIHYGAWLPDPVGKGFVNWLNPEITAFLFSGYHGLVPWAPGFLIGWIGLVVMGFRLKYGLKRALAWGFAIGMIAQVYINASVWDWWGGGSYGPRRMTFLLAPTALGLACILQNVRFFLKGIIIIGAVGWGIFTMAAFYEEVDDLTLLFTGEPDPMRPVRCTADPEITATRWQRWRNGQEKILQMGFSLIVPARQHYRWWGVVALAAISGLAIGFQRLCTHKPRLQYAVFLVLTAYILTIFTMVTAFFPSNMPWHPHWAAVVEDRPAEHPEDVPPDDYLLAVTLVRTWNALNRYSDIGILAPEEIYFDGFPGIDLETLGASVSN